MSCLLDSRAFLLQVLITIAAIISDTLALNLPKTEASFDGQVQACRLGRGHISHLTVFLLLFPLDRDGTTVSPFTHLRLSQSVSFASLSLR